MKKNNLSVGGLLIGFFFFIAFFPLVEQNIRFAFMIGVAAIISLFVVIKPKYLLSNTLYVLAIVFIVATYITHSSYFPPLTDYAENKRLYFYFLFITCGMIFPLYFTDETKINNFVYVLVFTTIIMSFFALQEGETSNIRRRASELNPTLHSKLLFYPVMLLIAKNNLKGSSKYLVVIALFGAIACVFTGSRGAIVAIVVTTIIYYSTYMKPAVVMKMAVTLLLAFIGFYFAIDYLPVELAQRFSLDSLLTQNREGDRLFLYVLSAEIINENFHGIGLGNMSNFYYINAPHNIFLELVMDVGYLLSLPFFLLLFFAMYRAIKATRSAFWGDRFFAILFFYMFTNTLIGGELTIANSMFYVALGYLIVGYNPRRQKIYDKYFNVNLRPKNSLQFS